LRSEIFGNMIEDKKLHYNPNNLSSFIDQLIHLSKTDPTYNMKTALVDISDIFIASIHTTALTLQLALYCAALFPDKQEEVYNELLQVAEEDDEEPNKKYKWYSLKNGNQCPKLKAFIHESFRYLPPGPLGLQHNCSQDIKIDVDDHTYTIPKNTIVMINLEYISHSEDVWGKDYDQFSLNRWLVYDDNTKQTKFKLLDNEILFGAGRRDCVGKSFALKELEMVLGNWFLNYSIEWNNQYPKKFEKTFMLTYNIKPIPLIIKKRY